MLALVRRSLSHYWRTNLAVVAGVAAAVTVLAGALLVGDSVRGSLRDLVLRRLGATDLVLLSADFFRAALADDLRTDPAFTDRFSGATAIISLPALATNQDTGARASRVQVYGVDDQFWAFHGRTDLASANSTGNLLLSEALAAAIGAEAGTAVLLRVQRPSDIPLESLHGQKEDLGQTMRLVVGGVLAPHDLGEFSLQPQQGDVLAAFVPLASLQDDLDLAGRANLLLVSSHVDATEDPAPLEALVRRHADLEDVGLRIRDIASQQALALESSAALLDDLRVEAARAAAAPLGLQPWPVFTYLVNTIRIGDREVPYSLVSAVELEMIAPDLRTEEWSVIPIVFNDWAARDLGADVGDAVELEYFVWQDPGQLVTQTTRARVAAIVPLEGAAADRDLAPDYPGITESDTLRDWDPPFPIELDRIRPVDEEYWETWRTTPKAFIPALAGEMLWRSRYGSLTSIRLTSPRGENVSALAGSYTDNLRQSIDPLALGLAVRPVRSESLSASAGATNFGEYFTYFSFFLVVSAVMLAALFFKLGVEGRVREVGLLRAVGFTTGRVRRLFAAEALVLSVAGSAIGLLGALGYGALMMTGLRTWWVDAVGTTSLALHISPVSLTIGAGGGVLAAIACIWWTLGTLARISERSLLAGQLGSDLEYAGAGAAGKAGRAGRPAAGGRHARIAAGLLVIGLALIGLGIAGIIAQAGAFFGAGASLLVAALFGLSAWLRRQPGAAIAGHGWWPMSRLGARNAGYRPARSVLAVAVMASATFIVLAVDSFRRDGNVDVTDRAAGAGGYTLMVETLIPVVQDPASQEGREAIGVADFADVRAVPFRVLPGDDASCLNLYQPRQPRIIAPGAEFIQEGRFAFSSSLERSDEERENPWLLLEQEDDEGAIPVIADANSMTYVLHKSLGDEILYDRGTGEPIRLRLVAALYDSMLQGELVMSEENFLRLFPEQEGYQLMLVETPPDQAAEVGAAMEDWLDDYGADATLTGERIAQFHRVENTYLSTFQTLGGLGLLLGTVGLAAVLLRNVLERRRELALLGAVGFGRDRLFLVVIAESALLLAFGLVIGAVCALISIAPAALERGATLPAGAGVWAILAGVFVTGLMSSAIATRAAVQSRLLDALRAE